MDIYLLRHGLAEPLSASKHKNDGERSLTAEGKRKMRRIAHGMKALDLSFDLILSSPLLRAKQTAQIVAEVFQLTQAPELTLALAAGQNTKNVIEALKKHRDDWKGVLLVGHEPDLSRLISLLISGDSTLSISLKKGGLAKLVVDAIQYGRCAALEWLMAPSQLTRIR